LVYPAPQIQILNLQIAFSHEEVVTDHDRGNRPEKGSVPAEPTEYECLVIGQQFPRHQGDAHKAGNYAARPETDSPRPSLGNVICRRDNMGPTVHIERRTRAPNPPGN